MAHFRHILVIKNDDSLPEAQGFRDNPENLIVKEIPFRENYDYNSIGTALYLIDNDVEELTFVKP
jgi:hypothetical protein